jgi:hypothetical protein
VQALTSFELTALGIFLQIYGKEQLFDAERVVDLLQALETFSVASTSAQGSLLPTAGGSAAARCAPMWTHGTHADAQALLPHYCSTACLLPVIGRYGQAD